MKTQEKGSPFYLPMFLLFPSSVFFQETPGSHLLAFLFCLEKRAPFRHSVRIGCVCHSFSHVQLFSTPCTVARQAPLSMGFSRHEYWSGLPFPSPGDLPHPGIEPRSPALQTDYLQSESLRGGNPNIWPRFGNNPAGSTHVQVTLQCPKEPRTSAEPEPLTTRLEGQSVGHGLGCL